MSTSDSEATNELLKTISLSLKGIHNSLEQLTAAVEGVAESIEKAHEPEGDLGVHLVSSLKELTSALHKRAQQERSFQPQKVPRQQNQNHQQGRRDERQQQRHHRQENLPPYQENDHPVEDLPPGATYDQPDEPTGYAFEEQIEVRTGNHQQSETASSSEDESQVETARKDLRPRTNRRRRGGNGGGRAGKASEKTAPKP